MICSGSAVLAGWRAAGGGNGTPKKGYDPEQTVRRNFLCAGE